MVSSRLDMHHGVLREFAAHLSHECELPMCKWSTRVLNTQN